MIFLSKSYIQNAEEQKEMANKEENEDVAMQRLLGQMKRYSTSS
jgi:hypothetical protein